MQTPAQLLRALREHQGRSARSVATAATIAPPVYGRFENSTNPTWSSITRWADELGATITVIVSHPDTSHTWTLTHGPTFRTLLTDDTETITSALTQALATHLPGTDSDTVHALAATLHWATTRAIHGALADRAEQDAPRITVSEQAELEQDSFAHATRALRSDLIDAVIEGRTHTVLAADVIANFEANTTSPPSRPIEGLHEFMRWADTVTARTANDLITAAGYGLTTPSAR